MDNPGNFPIKTNDIKVGDRIIIVLKKENHMDRGYVRFVGELSGMEGVYYGIELDEAKGLHDGKSYFKTQQGHGTFMRLTNLRKVLTEDFDAKVFNDMLKKEQQQKLQESKVSKTTGPNDGGEDKPADKPTVQSDPASHDKPEAKPEAKPDAKPTPAPVTPTQAASPVKVDSPVHKTDSTSPTTKATPKAAEDKPASPTKTATAQPTAQIVPQKVVDHEATDKKVKEVEAQYQELMSKRDKDILTLKSRVKTLEDQLTTEKAKSGKSKETEGLEREFQVMESKFSDMSIEYESLKSELENTKYQLDEAKLRIQELEFDKEEMMLNAELVAQDAGQGQQMSDSDVSKLKENYGYLKMAFGKLEEKNAADKVKYETKIQELMEKAKNSDGINSEQLKRTLREKERTIQELKERLDDNSTNDTYIASLTEQIMNEKNSKQIVEDNLRDARHTIKINDEMLEQYEEMNGLLQSEMDAAQQEILSMKERLLVLTEEKKADEAVITKYREKIKLIQGEIDIIKTQTGENKDQDRNNKIEQLIKNYTLCLQEKRSVVKKLIVSEYKDIKDAKQNLRWSIIIKSIPTRFVQELEFAHIDKFLSLLELIKKIDLIVGQFKSNYLTNPLIIEDNIDLIGYISTCLDTLLNAKRIIEYIYDVCYNCEKLEDLKNLTRSPMFGVLVSLDVFFDRLITEIRDDNFTVKFNMKLLEDNNTKLLEMVNELSRDLREVKMRDAIEIRYYAKLIELQYLIICNFAESKKQLTENYRTNVAKVTNVNQAIATDQSWIRLYEEIIKHKKHVIGGNHDDSTTTVSSVANSSVDSSVDADAKLFFIDKVKPAWEVIEVVMPKILKGEDASVILSNIEDSMSKYILTNAKKPRKSDEEEEYPFKLFSEMGPWMDTVNYVKRKLEKFDELQRDNADKHAKIEEGLKKLAESEQKIDNALKVRATLENRIKDLEFKNQNIPLIENERARAVEQTKILNADIEKLKKEISVLDDKVKLGGNTPSSYGGVAASSSGGVFSGLLKKTVEERRILPNAFKPTSELNPVNTHQPPAHRGSVGGLMRLVSKEFTEKPQAIAEQQVSAKSLLSYERIIENLHSQLIEKDEGDIFDNAKMMKEMPYFYKLYAKEKKRSQYGNSVEAEGKMALGRLNLLNQQIKNKVVAKRVIDITTVTEKDPVKRLRIFTEQINSVDRDIEEDKEKALNVLENFQSRWVSTYANLEKTNAIYSKLLTENSKTIANERVIGLVRLEKLPEEKLKQLEDDSNRVIVKKSEIVLKKAFKL